MRKLAHFIIKLELLNVITRPVPMINFGEVGPGGGVLRFGLVGDVPPAALDPHPCSGVNCPKKGTHFYGFFRKKVPIFSNFYKISKIRPMFRDIFMKKGTHV